MRVNVKVNDLDDACTNRLSLGEPIFDINIGSTFVEFEEGELHLYMVDIDHSVDILEGANGYPSATIMAILTQLGCNVEYNTFTKVLTATSLTEPDEVLTFYFAEGNYSFLGTNSFSGGPIPFKVQFI